MRAADMFQAAVMATVLGRLKSDFVMMLSAASMARRAAIPTEAKTGASLSSDSRPDFTALERAVEQLQLSPNDDALRKELLVRTRVVPVAPSIAVTAQYQRISLGKKGAQLPLPTRWKAVCIASDGAVVGPLRFTNAASKALHLEEAMDMPNFHRTEADDRSFNMLIFAKQRTTVALLVLIEKES